MFDLVLGTMGPEHSLLRTVLGIAYYIIGKRWACRVTPVTMQKKKIFKVNFWKMASTSYNAVQVLDLLDADSSDSGSSGEKGDDI